MQEILHEIQSGAFAQEFLEAQRTGSELVGQMQQEVSGSLIESTGKELRSMMPWLKRR
jgi:ketol-acid reductoisomerase